MPRRSIPTKTFDPQAISILDSALDGAWTSLMSAGPLNSEAEAIRTELAKHIIRMATKGECDRQRLIQGSVARFRRTSPNRQQSPTPPARPRHDANKSQESTIARTSARLPDRFPAGSSYVIEA